MSLQVIVVAVIALVILVVLIMMMTGKTKIFTSAAADCGSKGGECLALDACPEGYTKMFGAKCPNTGEICCSKMEG